MDKLQFALVLLVNLILSGPYLYLLVFYWGKLGLDDKRVCFLVFMNLFLGLQSTHFIF
jgi:hypothetical protein